MGWQMAHQALSQETEFLRQRTAELQQLETEVVQLRHFAHTYQGLQQRLLQVELQESRGLKLENEGLKQTLASVLQERDALKNVVERCVAKLEKESLERPFLVDKRMVTQMMAAYLQQRDYPKQQLEIASKMADLLGFTIAERELVGLRDKRRTLLEPSPTGLMDLTSRFVDFLIEESESC